MDKVLLGTSGNKQIIIMTHKTKEVKKFIIEVLKKSVTEFDVKGGFGMNKKKALMTVITNNEYFKFKEGIKAIDKKSFLIVMDAYQVSEKNKQLLDKK